MTDHQMFMEIDEETGSQFPICSLCTDDWPCDYAKLTDEKIEIAREILKLEDVWSDEGYGDHFVLLLNLLILKAQDIVKGEVLSA